MAYQFPLEGGRINASVGGNSTSAGAGYSLVSTGTLLLAGGNNITLSQNGSAITISGANAPSGSINFSASNASANLASLTFGNANGVSFGLNAGSLTASVNTSYAASNHSHGNPTLNLTNISGTTASASNGLTLSLSAASQSIQTQNNIQGIIAAGSTNRTGDISFANSNGVTFGLSNNTMTASVAGAGGVALANSQTTYTNGTVNLFEAGGAITIGSTTGQRYNFSVPAQSSLAVTGALSISRNASTISIGAPAFSAGMSTFGNTSGTAGTASNQVVFAGGNNITLSQNTGTGGNTISIIGAAGGGGGIALANSQTTYTNGTVNLLEGSGAITIGSTTGQRFNLSVPSQSTISATGAVSISTNGSTISIGAPAFSAGMSTIGNTAGVAGTASNQLVLAGGNNITLSQAVGAGGNTISISAPNQSVQTQNSVAVMGSTGNIAFVNANNVSFGGNGSTITGSASFNQTNQNLSLYAAGNTTQNSSAVLNASNLSFNGAGGVSVGFSNGSIQISGAAGGGGGGGGGVAIANSQATYTNGTANFVEGGGAITIASAANQSLRFSVPATSSLAVTGGLNVSTAGNTVSLGVQPVPTLSRWEYPNNAFTSLGLNGNGSLSIEHMYVPFNISGSAMKIGGSMSAQTNTSVTTASVNISLWMGIYTLSGSTLSLASFGSALHGFQWSVSNSSTANTSINGMRQMTVPVDINMSAGEYWVAAAISSQTTYTSPLYSMYGNNLINSAGSGAVLMPIGAGTSSARDGMLFQGIYTTAVSAGPQSIIGPHINNLQPAFVMRANFYNAIYNATY